MLHITAPNLLSHMLSEGHLEHEKCEEKGILKAYDGHDVFLLQSTLHNFPDAESPQTVMSLATPGSVHHLVVDI